MKIAADNLVLAPADLSHFLRALASSPAVFGLDYEDVTFPSMGALTTLLAAALRG